MDVITYPCGDKSLPMPVKGDPDGSMFIYNKQD